MGPQSRRILCTYWYRLTMVACVGRYYGEIFQGFWGVTQGGSLSPTIFNFVIDVVGYHWGSLVVEGEEVPGG